MTVSTESRRAGPFLGDDATTDLAFTFPVTSGADVVVIHADADGVETTLALTTDYTVSLSGDQENSPGGTVTLLAPLAADCRAVVLGGTPYTQSVKVLNQGAFYPAVFNTALDKLVMQIQQMREQLLRTPSAPATATTSEINDHPSWQQIVEAWDGAQSAATAAQSAQAQAAADAALCQALELATRAAAEASGSVLFFDAYADASAALSGLSNDQIVDVLVDETRGGARVRYRVVAGELAYRMTMSDARGVNVLDYGAVGDGTTDDTSAVQAALDAADTVYIPLGYECIVNQITASDARILGPGTIKKKPGTNGKMIALSGACHLDGGLTIDYDHENALSSDPQTINISVFGLSKSFVSTGDVWFRRSFYSALETSGGSLKVSGMTKFSEGRPHNGLSGAGARPTYYVAAYADADTEDETIEICPGAILVGSQQDADAIHKNPAGFYSTDYRSGPTSIARFKSIKIDGSIMLYCGHNCGGNVAGPVDTYNGADNVVVSNNIFKYWAAGIILQNTSSFSVTGNIVVDGSAPTGSDATIAQGIIAQEKVRGDTAEQSRGSITGNVVRGCHYIGIDNDCDNVAISGNVIDGVTKTSGLGTGIYNAGNNVAITGNTGINISGELVSSSGNGCIIAGNNFAHAGNASTSGAVLSGDRVIFTDNQMYSTADDGYVAIYSDGGLSNAIIDRNIAHGYSHVVDLRENGGSISNVHIGINMGISISGSDVNVAAGCDGVTRSLRVIHPVTATYNPPSLAAGDCGTEQTATVTGAALGDDVRAVASIDTMGVEIKARVTAANTVKYFAANPAGNPNGTQDLGSMTVSFYVTKS